MEKRSAILAGVLGFLMAVVLEGLLSSRAPERETPRERREVRTRVQLKAVLEPPPEPEPLPKPEPPPKEGGRPPEGQPPRSRPEQKVTKVIKAVKAVTGKKNPPERAGLEPDPFPMPNHSANRALPGKSPGLTGSGAFPPLEVGYPELGFPGYASAMEGLGGKFFVWDAAVREIKGEIDLAAGRLLPLDPERLAGMSPRSRDLAEEPALELYLESARERFGPSRYRVLLLLPWEVDRLLVAGLTRTLERAGHSPGELASLQGSYTQKEGELVLNLTWGHTRQGERVPLSLTYNLSRGMGR